MAADLNLDQQKQKLDSSLFLAALSKDDAPIQSALAAGANPNVQNKHGKTPLHSAVRAGNVKVVKALLAAGADPNSRDDLDRSPLHWAALRGFAGIVRALLDAGANQYLPDVSGFTSIHYAALYAAHYRQVACIQVLVAAGTDLNACDGHGETPLHNAAAEGYLEVVQALLSGGADPNHACRIGRTALHLAAKSLSAATVQVVQVLLAAGADADARDVDGRRPEDGAHGDAKVFLSARRQALSEGSDLLASIAPATARPRSSAL